MVIVFLLAAAVYVAVIGSTAALLHIAPKLAGAHETTLVELEEIAPDFFHQSKNDSLSSY